jgi:hypothetical protein
MARTVRTTRLRTIVRLGPMAVAAAFVVLQLVPYGRAHSQPPVVQEPSWHRPPTRELAVRACFDCHSNETTIGAARED